MMKSLLVLMASLTMLSASAQLKSSHVASLQQPPSKSILAEKSSLQVQEMQMRSPGSPTLNVAPKRDGDVHVWYRRPAGAFPASIIVEDGTYAGFLNAPYLHVKPYCDYTFLGFAEGVSDQATYEWDVLYWEWGDDPSNDQQLNITIPEQNLTWRWGYETDEVPTFYVIEPDAVYSWWYPGNNTANTSPFDPNISPELKSEILSVPSTMDIWDMDILMSSKTFLSGGNGGDYFYPMTFYSGAEPYGQNSKGWWFGKNGYHQVVRPNYFVDGIAQAFEKPTAPYLLNQVVMDCGVLEVTGEVDLTCRVYKLDRIPDYNDTAEVYLPEVPGELIVKGRATLTPETNAITGGLVFFTLYGEEDGLEYDITPMIDYPILIVVDGYNDPEMANLQDFSAMIASNVNDDEGFGELAYLKFGRPDDDGNVSYVWAGLNNFFASGTMKTGFSIFINADMPYLTFRYDNEDGEYFFDREGGLMEKDLGDVTTRSIEFLSWTPSADDEWYVHRKGEEELPDWLEIELYDEEQDGEWNGLVTAEVIADPLPEGVRYREAVVRFEFLGAYLDYKFIQRDTFIPPIPCGPGADGEINIGDLNYLIHLILNHMYDSCWDGDGDGELTVADINVLINIILYY